MKKKILILLLNAMAIKFICFAQPVLKYQAAVGGSLDDKLTCMNLTNDGGLIAGGYSMSNKTGDKSESRLGSNDYWIVKLDSNRIKQWDKTIGGSKGDELYSLQQTTDGGYILGGTSYSDASFNKSENGRGGGDYWIVKLDAAGNVQWDKTIGGKNGDLLSAVQQTTDGGYIVGGYSFSNKSGEKSQNNRDTTAATTDYWIAKLDASGNIQWNRTIGGNQYEMLTCLQQTKDGGYIVGGWSVSGVSGEKTEINRGGQDYWIVKLNAVGNIEWDKTLGSYTIDELYSIQQTKDGGYILGGHSGFLSGGVTDYWIVKTDANGNTVWNKYFGGDDNDYMRSVQQTSDGGYLLGGYSLSRKSGDKTEKTRGVEDYWIVKTDRLGTFQWDKTIGGSNDDFLMSVREVRKNYYIAAGYSNSDTTGDKKITSRGAYDYWIVYIKYIKPNSIQITSENSNIINVADNNIIKVYPNPVKNILHIQSSTKAAFTLTNQSGEIIFTRTINGNGEINVSHLSAGLYYLRNNETRVAQKIIITK
jgi:hypothetical protein